MSAPKQRKSGQTGGGGYKNHGPSMGRSVSRGGRPHAGGGGGGNKDKSCCFAGQAVKAVWMGKFKLARRFARLDYKTRLGLI